jgi:hypothetical protein
VTGSSFSTLAHIRFVAVASLFWASASIVSSQSVVNVASIQELQSAIDGASSGDVLVLANGTYTNSSLTIGTSHVTVRAATPGGVYLNGTQSIAITGDDITFSGFQFTSGNIGTALLINVYGSRNKLTQLNFNGYSAKKYIHLDVGTQYNEISYCNFQNKPTSAPIGNLIHIAPDTLIPGYHTIRYCSFQHMPGAGGDNGNECIRISNGATSTYVSRTVVEYCYFEDTGMGDSEALSVKCRENVLRYNTFKNNPNAMMVFRNGDNNIAYGNFFIDAGGIRVKEANNIYCYNNYFERSGIGGTMNAVTYMYVSPNLKNINFTYNTFVDCGMIDFDNGATNNTWANNIFKKSSGNIFTGSSSGISWSGNMVSGTLGISIPTGMTSVDPLLTGNSDGYFGLSASSPAINASSPSYPAIPDIAVVDDDPSLSLDISGQPRPSSVALKDVGCDEYTTGAITNWPLSLADVGPAYLGGPATGVTDDRMKESSKATPNGFSLEGCYPNPFNPGTRIEYRIQKSEFTKLGVYDLLGREVAVLANEVQEAGSHSVTFNAAGLPSGLYLCRLTAGTFSATKKMVLTK